MKPIDAAEKHFNQARDNWMELTPDDERPFVLCIIADHKTGECRLIGDIAEEGARMILQSCLNNLPGPTLN